MVSRILKIDFLRFIMDTLQNYNDIYIPKSNRATNFKRSMVSIFF